MPRYAEQLKAHLSNYKRSHLKVDTKGEWSDSGRFYDHILPKELYRQNILEEVREPFWQYARENGLTQSLHRDFHHLNSSQALAFNLFFRFLNESATDSDVLLRALGVAPKSIVRWSFEEVPDSLEGTNFDVIVQFADESRLLVELKLSETEFGQCVDDKDHRDKLEDIYRARLKGKVVEETLAAPAFFKAYQLLRNVSHLRNEDRLVLIVPRANKSSWKEADSFIKRGLLPETQSAVTLVALEDVLVVLGASESRQVASYAESLAAKYCQSLRIVSG